MRRIGKDLAVWIIGGIGLLLTLSGLKLIQLSENLALYAGLSLLVLSFLLYILPDGKAKNSGTGTDDMQSEMKEKHSQVQSKNN